MHDTAISNGKGCRRSTKNRNIRARAMQYHDSQLPNQAHAAHSCTTSTASCPAYVADKSQTAWRTRTRTPIWYWIPNGCSVFALCVPSFQSRICFYMSSLIMLLSSRL
ncbi:hypothetical protein CYLTODRAFT_285478 [Cylindrobasidium torrendii FP15055 ss-10]|uniref:Uncharacterized protein n=1 Tax=Cylindrobasidium torrendii FP15055 ss-10 TaxID=1314674 RepID=A0A0D7BRV1_9AGAR|nr:hypothetical protein CYLTODRAFT_285478 [Cylindrobasidium torrendii FP15055 ss-10]